MAWEEESIESGADFEEVGGRKKKIKMILILVVVIGLSAAGWMFKDKILGGGDKAEDKDKKEQPAEAAKPADGTEASAPAEPGAEGVPAASGFQVKLEKFTVNLASTGSPHYMVTTIVLEVTTQILRDEYVDVEDKTLAMIKTRDTINELLGSKTVEEARDPAARKELAKEIKFRLNRFLKSGQVANVYFNDVLVD